MKTKIKPIIFFFLILIILIIGIVFIIKGNKSDRVVNLWGKLSQSKIYTFSMEKQNSEYQYKLIMSKRDLDFCIDMYNVEEHTSTLSKNGYIYYIMHNEQEYYPPYQDSGEDMNFIENAFDDLKDKEYKKGKEVINGKTYYYEEYNNISEFLMTLTIMDDNSAIKTRFYFEGNKIKYIKNTVGENEELLKMNCSFDVDDNNFNIPFNYAEK